MVKACPERRRRGNILSIYERPHADSAIKQTEVHIYGSSRLGIEQRNITYSTSPFAWLDAVQHRDAGTKRYELTDHLGNVRVTISDLLVPRPASSFGYATQDAEVIDRRDYYPFGMEMPGRRWRATGEDAARFGFNGKENDNEVKGQGNSVDYDARILDTRLGVWLSVDPLASKYPSLSPYCFVANNPIYYVDPDGREIWIAFDVTNKDGSTTQQKVQYKDGALYGTDGKAYTGGNEYATKVMGDLNQLTKDNADLGGRICTLQESKNIHTIGMVTDPAEGNSHQALDQDKRAKGEPTGSNVQYDPDAKESVTGDKRSPRVGLAHELLGHSYDSDQGTTNMGNTDNGIKMREVSAVNAENKARAATGDPKRTTYGGKEIPAKLLDDTHKEK